MDDKTYIFQFAGYRTEVIDSDLITLEEAKQLWKENYPKCIEYIQRGLRPQMYIWSDMDENYMFDTNRTVAVVDYDYITDGQFIYPPKPEPIPINL